MRFIVARNICVPPRGVGDTTVLDQKLLILSSMLN